MSQIQYQVYDFASSARVERPLWLAFHHWMEKTAELFVEQWSNFSATPIQAVPMNIDAESFEQLQARWKQPAYGAEISFKNDTTTGMMVIERMEMLRLLMDILGDDSEPSDRELTSVETSLCSLIFEQSATTLGQSWPEQESLTFDLGDPDDQPNRSRLFPPEKKLLTSGLQLQLGDANIRLQLMLAKDETCQMLGVNTQVKPPNPDNKISPEAISELVVQVTAGLGHSELGMSDLVAMSVGDIIVFDQSVEQPLVVYANDEPVFRAWPGRVAQQQALSIDSPLD